MLLFDLCAFAQADEDEDLDDDMLPLSVLFREAEGLFRGLDGDDAPAPPIAGKKGAASPLSRCLALLDKMSARLRTEGVFSSNEELDDVKTCDLRYLLVDHWRAVLVPKMAPGGGFDPRLRHALLKRASTFHSAFLATVDRIGALTGPDKEFFDAFGSGRVDEIEADDGDDGDGPAPVVSYRSSGGGPRKMVAFGASTMDANALRANKVARFKAGRGDAARLAELEAGLRRLRAAGREPDDDAGRECALLALTMAARRSLDDLDAHTKESAMLSMMASRMPPGGASGGGGGGGAADDGRMNRRGGAGGGGGAGSLVMYDAADPARPGLQVRLHASLHLR